MKKTVIISVILIITLLVVDILILTGVALDLKYSIEPSGEQVPVEKVYALEQKLSLLLIANFIVLVGLVSMILIFKKRQNKYESQ